MLHSVCFLWHIINLDIYIYIYEYERVEGGLLEKSPSRSFIQVRSEQWLVERLDRFFTATLIYCLLLTWIANDGVADLATLRGACSAKPLGRPVCATSQSRWIQTYLAGVSVELVHIQSLNPVFYYVFHFLYIETLPEHYYYLGPLDLFFFFLTPMKPEGQLCSGL